MSTKNLSAAEAIQALEEQESGIRDKNMDHNDRSSISIPNRPKAPKRTRVSKSNHKAEAQTVPNLNDLLSDALSIIGNELARYRGKTSRGNTLDLKEARAVQGYMDSLVKMNRESRESAKQEKLDHLSDQELLEVAKQYLVEEDTKEEAND